MLYPSQTAHQVKLFKEYSKFHTMCLNIIKTEQKQWNDEMGYDEDE